MPRLSSKLRDLLNAEVFQWEPGEIVWQASERQGPVEVWYRGVLVASYPFWAHWRLDGRTGDLYLFDPLRGGQRIGYHRAGTWSEVGHHLHRPVELDGPQDQ